MAEDSFSDIEAPAEMVELFEDRAAVTRVIRVAEAGRHRVRIGPLTPLVDVRRLSFPKRAEGLVVEEVRVRRESKCTGVDEAVVGQLTERLAEVREQREAQSDRVRRCREANLRARQAAQAAESATTRALQEQDDAASWVHAIEALAQHHGQTLRDVAEAELELTRVTDLETEIARELDLLRRGTDAPPEDPLSTSEVVAGPEAEPVVELCGFIELSLLAKAPGEQRLRYVVPCAMWRPTHRAHLGPANEEGVAPLHWETSVACWNATGEDWAGVQVVCTTAREGERARPPAIQDDVIRLQAPGELPDDPSDEVERDVVPGVKEATDLPAVDDGGEPRSYTLPELVALPSDGQARSFVVEQWDTETVSHWWSVPEHSGLVVRRSEQANTSEGVLLAGPVDLVHSGSSIGRSSVPMVRQGASFLLPWGSDSALQVRRKRETEIERQKSTGTLTRTFRVGVVVQNSGATVQRVRLMERVPISEYSDVFVSPPETNPAVEMDDNGFCTWEINVEPRGHERISLTYTVRAAADADLPFQGP